MEAFISDLTGTTMLELVLVSVPIPMGLWLLAEAKALLAGRDKILPPMGLHDFMLEVLVVLFPAIASMVWPSLNFTVVLSMAFTSLCCRLQRRHFTASSGESGQRTKEHEGMIDPVTNIRASIMLMTCITILAYLRFFYPQVFPRRFAKTEVFGTGLMDLGVGATIFASGLASGCRTKPQSRHAELGWSVWRTVVADIASAAIRAWPLAALGVSRLLVIKSLGYQEHVSEYGVHWNFFATLFFMRLVVVPMNRIGPVRLKCYLAIAAICGYQWLLLKGGLSEFIVLSPRDTLFAMNREGVLGLVGFVAIYYIAEELGSQIKAQREKPNRVSPRFLSKSVAIAARANAILWGLTLFSEAFIQQTSRRMMNLTYVLWVCAHSMLMLVLLMVVDSLSFQQPISQILAAINLNMFPVFMAANLATGAVNMFMRTLDADTPTAIAILATYAVFLAGFAVALASRGFTIKV
ncbi:unnamed protein product [Pylaiella littoralis]